MQMAWRTSSGLAGSVKPERPCGDLGARVDRAGQRQGDGEALERPASGPPRTSMAAVQ